MPWSLLTLPMLLPAYVLVLFRVAGMLAMTPIFGSRSVPVRVRALFAATAALVVFPLLLPTIPAKLTLHMTLVGGVGELMIGALIGLMLRTLFFGAQLAGTVVGQQAGLSLGQSFNPAMESSSTTLGQLYFIVLFMMFLGAGGHRAVVEALLHSFRTVPLLSFSAGESHVALITELLHSAVVIALKLAGPALIAMFMTTIMMGLLTKTMPQLNILSVGFVVRILVVLFVGAMALATAGGVLSRACDEAVHAMRIALGLA